jgi:hypothetical protein
VGTADIRPISISTLRALAILENAHDDTPAVMQLPGPLGQRLRTTNGVERR